VHRHETREHTLTSLGPTTIAMPRVVAEGRGLEPGRSAARGFQDMAQLDLANERPAIAR
jgi:hypothetical protein